jgi:hypothetical protein
MSGPSVGPVSRCPFAHCAADVMLVVEQAAPGDDESTLKRVPQHRIVGEGEHFGQCPASLMVIPLDAYSREALKTQAQAMALMLKGGGAPPEPKPTGGRQGNGHSLEPHPSNPNPIRWNPGRGTGGTNVPQAGKAGRGVVPLPDLPHAGPGPGRASAPFPPRADDIVEVVPRPKLKIIKPDDQPQGSTGDVSDNDLRSQLIALTNLAIEGFAQQQEQCSALSGMIETNFAAVRKALEDKNRATHSVALAAVGSRSSIPAAAANMIGASANASSTIGEIEKSAALLLGWVAATHAYAASAAAEARAYLAVI